MSVLLLRAKDIYRMEGLISLLRTSFDYVKRRVFEYRSYYLYEIPTGELDEADFLPQIGNFMFKVISSNEEADELAASFGFDLRQRFIDARKRLDKGAIAFCIFVGKEFANIGWVSLSEEAKKTLDPLPLKVDFAANEAYVGAVETSPKYRNNRLMKYGSFKRRQFLRTKGIRLFRSAVAESNTAPKRVNTRLGGRIYAEARYVKILWWNYWKENPLTQSNKT